MYVDAASAIGREWSRGPYELTQLLGGSSGRRYRHCGLVALVGLDPLSGPYRAAESVWAEGSWSSRTSKLYKPRLWEVVFILYNMYKDRRTDAEAIGEHGKRRRAYSSNHGA